MRKLAALTLFDVKYIYRDFMLIISVVAPLLLAVMFRIGLPVVAELFSPTFVFDPESYRVLLASILFMTVPVMLGMFAAFIILDEQDENVLMFLAVTPISKQGYLLYRLTAPVVAGTILSPIALLIAGYGDLLTWTSVWVIPFFGLVAPLVTLFIVSIAHNKVEGLAISKAASILLLVPFVHFFVEGKLSLIGGVLPPYWTIAAFLSGLEKSTGDLVLYLVISFCLHGVLIYMLLRRFKHS